MKVSIGVNCVSDTDPFRAEVLCLGVHEFFIVLHVGDDCTVILPGLGERAIISARTMAQLLMTMAEQVERDMAPPPPVSKVERTIEDAERAGKTL